MNLKQPIKIFILDKFGYEDEDLTDELISLIQEEVEQEIKNEYDKTYNQGYRDGENDSSIAYNSAYQDGYAAAIDKQVETIVDNNKN